jgi:hypothetical protein
MARHIGEIVQILETLFFLVILDQPIRGSKKDYIDSCPFDRLRV